MRLQKAPPGGVLAPDRCRIQPVAPANVINARITQRVTQVVQGPDDAVATPSRVFLDQLEDEFFEFRI